MIVALDVPGAGDAHALVARIGEGAGMYKVGSQLFTAAGPGVVRELTSAGRAVFLDLKYHDIPNTVASAVASACGLGVSLLDVHALGGAAMIEAAAGARRGAPVRLLAITVLTSHDEATLQALGLAGPIPDLVVRLARLAREAGADGVVASPHEVAAIRAACGPGFVIVTPGIRPTGATKGDQLRITTPAAAIRNGSDYLVVGRPITEAPDPSLAAAEIVREIESER